MTLNKNASPLNYGVETWEVVIWEEELSTRGAIGCVDPYPLNSGAWSYIMPKHVYVTFSGNVSQTNGEA